MASSFSQVASALDLVLSLSPISQLGDLYPWETIENVDVDDDIRLGGGNIGNEAGQIG